MIYVYSFNVDIYIYMCVYVIYVYMIYVYSFNVDKGSSLTLKMTNLWVLKTKVLLFVPDIVGWITGVCRLNVSVIVTPMKSRVGP